MRIPFEEIKDSMDRSWSERLVEIVATSSSDDPIADDASDALSEVRDPAVTNRLFAIATDRLYSDAARERALRVINDSGLTLEGDDLRSWWNSDDPLLRQEALINAYRTEVDYLRPVAQDVLHPMHKHAIAALEVGMDDAEWQGYVVRALSHFDPEIQEVAAEICIWEEPIAAEPRLIELANDSDIDIAIRAIKSLAYFHSRTALRALHDLARDADDERAEEARSAAENLANDFYSELNDIEDPAARDGLMHWMRPVFDVVAIHQVDRSFDGGSHEAPAPLLLPVHGQALASALTDTRGRWDEKRNWLSRAEWSEEPEGDRPLLRDVLLHHVDPMVRKHASRIVAGWNDVDALLELTSDRYSMVRQPAVYWLESVSQSADAADVLWSLISSDAVGGWAAREALDSWVQHYDADPTEQLVDIVLRDTRTTLRWSAVNELGTEKVDLMSGFLHTPPAVSWSLHALVLDNLAQRGLRPANLASFLEVDDLYVAVACAKFAAAE